MAKIAKRVAKANEAFAGKANITVEDAVKLIKGAASTKFDETLEIAMNLGVDPRLIHAVIWQESKYKNAAVSHAGAQGLMQLIPETAARFGVRNAMDPTQNVRGGMAYLRWLLARYQGDVVLAAAAYNAGEGAVERYLGVPPYSETRQYVWKIVSAAGGMLSHPFDGAVTAVSEGLPLMRRPWRVK